MLLGGIVDENVELAERANRLPDKFLAVSLVADIASDRKTTSAFGLDQAVRFFGVLGFIKVRNRDVGPLFGEEGRDGAADSTIAAGDQRDLPRSFPEPR